MKKVKLILTLDYEIFGNGTGSVKWCMVEPTEKILKIADKYNVPITIMAEMAEYWGFKNNEKKIIKEQLINAIKRGHDVQLHIHPQYLKFCDSWRMSSLTYSQALKVLKKGKEDLEKMLRPYKEDYECFVFRAGAGSIQPEEHIIKALVDNGFKIDSSVIKGAYFRDSIKYFDFRDVPEKPFWFSDKDITKEMDIYPESNGILELPTYAENFNLVERILFKIFYKKPKNRALNCNGFLQSKESFFKRLTANCRILDFSLLSYKEMLFVIWLAENRKFEDYDIIPIVITGHSKCFNSPENFEKFIKEALGKGYEFKTFGDWA